jgi:hypothetical protein
MMVMKEVTMSFPIKLSLVLLLSPLCWCQQAPTDLTARTLWLQEQPDKDQLPSIAAAKAHQVKKVSLTSGGAAAKQSAEIDAQRGAPENGSTQSMPSIPVVKHLGLRYNLLLVDAQSGKTEPVDSDRVFQPGDCIQMDLEANHSGYLYVLDRGSSGNWKPLLPSPEMPEESNIVSSRTRVRVPQGYCFTIEGPPGDERLFVMLARNPAELYDLHDSIKSGAAGTGASESGGAGSSVPAAQPVSHTHAGTPVMTAELRLSHEVNRMEASMGRRDLKITKIANAEDAAEPPGSVYVVNTSEASSDKVVIEIRIKHN